MDTDEIANHVAVMIAALREEAEKYARGDQFVFRMLTDARVVAAAVTARLASIQAKADRAACDAVTRECDKIIGDTL